MAGGFYIPDGLANCVGYGQVTGTTAQTSTTTGAANTKGSYTQLTASTTADATCLMVESNTVASGNATSKDIAIGAAGSEKIIIPDLVDASPAVSFHNYTFWPVSIPSGTRIAFRAQSTSASDTPSISIWLFDNGTMGRGSGIIDTIGFVSASTQGTTVDAGATANTKGSYAQITASTSVDYAGFCCHFDTLAVNFAASVGFLIDIAIGAAASEKVIIPNLYVRGQGGGMMMPPFTPWFDMPIRSGTRIAVRAQCSSNTSTNRQFGFIFYGLRG